MSGTGTGSASITNAIYRIYLASTVAECGAAPQYNPTTAVLLNPGAGQTVGGASYSGTALTIAAGGTAIICQTAAPPVAATNGDSATQTITWTSTGGF